MKAEEFVYVIVQDFQGLWFNDTYIPRYENSGWFCDDGWIWYFAKLTLWPLAQHNPSLVKRKKDSKIVWPKNWNGKTREIRLDAYFWGIPSILRDFDIDGLEQSQHSFNRLFLLWNNLVYSIGVKANNFSIVEFKKFVNRTHCIASYSICINLWIYKMCFYGQGFI